MKKLTLFIIISFIFLFFQTALESKSKDSNNEIIAIVNGEEILLKEFKRLYNIQTKNISKKIIDKLINEALILQEAKSRSINAPDEETRKKLDLIIEKQGGVLSFVDFLKENNATIQDAEDEIKNQIIIELLNKELSKDNTNQLSLKDLLADKKSKANIVVYTNKLSKKQAPEINPAVNKEEQIISEENKTNNLKNIDISLINDLYPTITRSKAEEIEKLEENTNAILRNNIPVIRDSDFDMKEFEKKYSKKKIRFPFFSSKNTLNSKKIREKDVPLLNKEQIHELESSTRLRQNIKVEKTN